MSKSNFFIKYLNIINNSINSLLEKNLNKLNFNNLRNLIINNKIVLTFVALFVLFTSYLLIPTFYNKIEVSNVLQSKLSKKLGLNFQFSDKLNYNFFPSPHFIIDNSNIIFDGKKISKIKKIKINISFNYLFSLKDIAITDVIIDDANFDINKKNSKFFLNILDNKFGDVILKIKNSNIFFRNSENEVLFINKILNMKYYYDQNELQNIIYSDNELFNIPYSVKFYDDKRKRIFFTKLNLNFIKLQIENELDYTDEVKIGKSNIIFNKSKSNFSFELDNNTFDFNFFEKGENPNFSYEGTFNFNPFYSNLNGLSDKFDLSYIVNSNTFIPQLIKTELFNNKNINFKSNIIAKTVFNNVDFANFKFNSRINEGLIDIDNTSFEWKKIVNFKIEDSLVYIKDGELILDGKLDIYTNNYMEIYKYLLTPKNFRKKFNNIKVNFTYNFDQKTTNFGDIRIDSIYDRNINKILNNVILKENKLQNKIYLKNLLNEAIKSYSG